MIGEDGIARIEKSRAASGMFALKSHILSEVRREAMRAPRGSAVRDSMSRRDPEDPDALILGSYGTCDVTSAIKGTVVVYVPPED